MTTAMIEYDVEVPMRDGVILRADVYRPVGEGPWPVVVVRSPYGKGEPTELQFFAPLVAVSRGLIAVVQDVRGRFQSEGEGDWRPAVAEAADGADTVAWAATLPGSSGAVGMWGSSYMGNAQWLAGGQRPPALRAIAPNQTFRTVTEGLTHRGGARELATTRGWSLSVGVDMLMRRHQSDPEAMQAGIAALVAGIDQIPGPTYDELPTGSDRSWAPLRLPTFDDPAARTASDVTELVGRVDIPVLNTGGWFDIFLQGTLDNFAHGNSDARLIIGPWSHLNWGAVQGEVNFGIAGDSAAVDLGDSLHVIMFDWLRDRLNGVVEPDRPPVRIFVMGANQWRDEVAWPLERAVATRFFLDAGDRLTTGAPAGSSTVGFTYDPGNPVPTLGGSTMMIDRPAGSCDQARVEARDDVVVFTTDVLVDDLEVTGRVTATLTVDTDAPTTDWVVRLCDVHPDGRSFNVADGITRVSGSGGPDRVEVDLWSTSMVFKRGHRVRVQVTSSCFPRWDRNLNTLGGFDSGEMQEARQTVYLGADSYVTLPVVASSGD
jgi:uncharacterized protein